MNNTFGFIGAGNMGGALARATAKSVDPKHIALCDADDAKAAALAAQLGCFHDTVDTVAANCQFLFLGVKPQVMGDMLRGIAPVLAARKDNFVLVSMAAGLCMKDIQIMVGRDYPLIRIMPNLPVAVGQGVILYDYTDNVPADAVTVFEKSLAGAGLISHLKESLIDAGSALSGCGPAFVSMFVEALADGAVSCGLTRQQATQYACQTLIGTARMLQDTGMHPGALKDAVCSPGGSTIAGVAALEQGALRAAVAEAVCSAFHRTKELGK